MSATVENRLRVLWISHNPLPPFADALGVIKAASSEASRVAQFGISDFRMCEYTLGDDVIVVQVLFVNWLVKLAVTTNVPRGASRK